MNRLTSDGILYFSNNFTRFELDEQLTERYEIIDITQKPLVLILILKSLFIKL